MCSGERDVERLELPAPFAPGVEGERYLLRIAGINRLTVIFERRAPAAAVVFGDDERSGRLVGQPQTQLGDFARMQASETYGVRTSRVENRVREGDNPAFAFGLGLSCAARRERRGQQQH